MPLPARHLMHRKRGTRRAFLGSMKRMGALLYALLGSVFDSVVLLLSIVAVAGLGLQGTSGQQLGDHFEALRVTQLQQRRAQRHRGFAGRVTIQSARLVNCLPMKLRLRTVDCLTQDNQLKRNMSLNRGWHPRINTRPSPNSNLPAPHAPIAGRLAMNEPRPQQDDRCPCGRTGLPLRRARRARPWHAERGP